jgi:hypothetical protein
LVISKDIASHLTGRPVAVNGCWEYVYRCERDMGEVQQAEWYMRDILISLANGMKLIGPGIFFDCASGYGNGLWGGSGILTRGPYVYPKRSYVAYAALTAVLDQVRLRDQLPTGSTTAYALAFERADKQHATALWTARGAAEFTVTLAGASKARVFDMYGRETAMSGASLVIKGGTAPTYLLTDAPVQAVAVTGRSFPKDELRAARGNRRRPAGQGGEPDGRSRPGLHRAPIRASSRSCVPPTSRLPPSPTRRRAPAWRSRSPLPRARPASTSPSTPP